MSSKLLCLFSLSVLALQYCSASMVGEPAGEVGTIMELKTGHRVQMFIQDMQIKAYFIDEEGLVTETTGESIVFFVDSSGHKNDEWRGLLKPDEEGGFICTKKLYPPYECRARIIFRFTDQAPVTLSKYPVDLDKATGDTVSDDI